MLDDRELCEQLKCIYEATGIDLLGTEGEDNSSPERVEEKVVTRYEPKPSEERYEIAMDVEVSVDYKHSFLDIRGRAEITRIPFGAIPSLLNFLGWLVDEKIGKE